MGEKPIHNERIHDKDDPEEGLPKPHRRVFMIATGGAGLLVGVIVFVMGEE